MTQMGSYRLVLICDHDSSFSKEYQGSSKRNCVEQARADGWIFYDDGIIFHKNNPPPAAITVKRSELGNTWSVREHIGERHMSAEAKAERAQV